MVRKTSSFVAAVAVVGLTLASGSPVHASGRKVTVRTPSLVADPAGYVYCKVEAKADRLVQIVASINAADGVNVTEFGSSYRVSPEASTDGLFHAEETAGSFNDGARYCKTTVTGARHSDIKVYFTAYDAAGNVVGSVQVP
jgi:hypothetical protein